MPPIRIVCGACGRTIDVHFGGQAQAVRLRARDLGVAVECPFCGHRFMFKTAEPHDEPDLTQGEQPPTDD